jgi:hypothetical protein
MNPLYYLLRLCVVLVLLGIQSVAHAVTAVFQDGQATPVVGGAYSGTRDTMLLVNGGTNSATDNFGGRGEVTVGAMGFTGDPYLRRSLIKFDITALSGQAGTINSATLRLFLFNGNNATGGGTVNLFRVAAANAGWVEGGGIATGNYGGGSSTWASLVEGSSAWAGGTGGMGVAGVDYLSSAISSYSYAAIPGIGTAIDFVFSDVSFLGDWIAGNNGGLFLRQADETNAQNWLSFYSSETGVNWPTDTASASLRPQLIIDFDMVPEPSRFMIALSALMPVLLRRRRVIC